MRLFHFQLVSYDAVSSGVVTITPVCSSLPFKCIILSGNCFTVTNGVFLELFDLLSCAIYNKPSFV